MILQGRGSHYLTTLPAMYPGSLPLLKGWSLSRGLLFVCFVSMLSPDEPRRECHSLGLIQFFLQADPHKHSCHCRQRCLHLDRISSCYLSVICIEAYVVFPCQPPKTVLSLLGSTDLLKGCPDYCIHYDVKQCRGNRVSLRHPSPRAEGSPIVLPLLCNHPLSVPIPL